MPIFSSLGGADITALLVLTFVAGSLYTKYRSGVKTTKLPGPPSHNPFFGLFAHIRKSTNQVLLYDNWAKDYGPVYSLPMGFGHTDVVITDVKAASHFLARDTMSYQQTPFSRVIINLLINLVLTTLTPSYASQRKALTPAFSNAALRGYINVFYDSVYRRGKQSWSLERLKTEVQQWMNSITLDNLGIAGFGYNFHCLDGNKPAVTNVFDAFQTPEKSGFFSSAIFFLIPASTTFSSTKTAMQPIAEGLIKRMKKELIMVDDKHTDKTIIGLLIKAESASSGFTLSGDEILAQWALIELARNPEMQERLRNELAEFSGTDPTWEQLTLDLPYLNAVAQETLRCHPPVRSIPRVAMQDDVIPLSDLILTKAGELITELVIAKGTVIHCPIGQINQSDALWGADAKEFKPERWVDRELLPGAKGIQGHHHVLTFSDGPRLCIGRNFALANFKATLSVLIRNFSFELPGGINPPIGAHMGILPRPRIESEKGPRVPLRIKRLE
ncbi:cytochrome P450 [Coprinopsis marcescibilis]|uniref:Cytochrome P450 n=1 Tax=Coprinopsis marcescibilis TaxID=230819 RepID=A0A5C3L798_COPMA|nr:cytochrome P450 [Coprinopsis marcescibilis]